MDAGVLFLVIGASLSVCLFRLGTWHWKQINSLVNKSSVVSAVECPFSHCLVTSSAPWWLVLESQQRPLSILQEGRGDIKAPHAPKLLQYPLCHTVDLAGQSTQHNSPLLIDLTFQCTKSWVPITLPNKHHKEVVSELYCSLPPLSSSPSDNTMKHTLIYHQISCHVSRGHPVFPGLSSLWVTVEWTAIEFRASCLVSSRLAWCPVFVSRQGDLV